MEGLLELSAPTTLSTPAGDITLNGATGARYMVLVDQSDAGQSGELRGAATNLSQADGARIPERFQTAYLVRYTVQCLYNGGIAIGATLVSMLDDLAGAVDSILNAEGTLTWTPSGGSATELTGIRALELVKPVAGSVPRLATFAVDSPLPAPVLV